MKHKPTTAFRFFASVVLIAFGMTLFADCGFKSDSLSDANTAAVNPYPSGRVDTLALDSRLVKSPMAVNVALPGGYFADSSSRYPVLYLLHGHGGNRNTWGRLIALDSAATSHKMIIVTLDGRNSWYWDSPLVPDLQMESFITRELVPTIDSLFRTIPDRSHRAVTGLSMGGHGAMWLALHHKDMFGNVGSTSGGVDIMPFPNRWNIDATIGDYAKCNDSWKSHSVMSHVDSITPGDYNIIFDCGTEDFFFDVNNRLDSILTARGIEHTYLTSPGIHNGDYWKKSILPQLDFFEKHFNKN